MIVDPRANEQPEPGPAHARYAEDRCAAGPRLYAPLVIPGALLVGVVASAALGSLVGVLICAILFVLLGFVIGTGLMIRLPLDIRLDERGVRIGGIRYNEKHPGRIKHRDAPLRGFTRAMHVYSCPWSGVRRAVVLSELADKRLAGSAFGAPADGPWWSELAGITAWAPGKFINVTAKGLFVVEVETSAAHFQEFRPPKGSMGAGTDDLVYRRNTMTWVVPTRHPEELRAALRAGNVPEN